MILKEKNIGIAMTGSFCTFSNVITELRELQKTEANLIPILSYQAQSTDTRFGKAEDFIRRLEDIC